MRRLKSGNLFAAAAGQIYRKHLLRSAPIREFSHRPLSAAADAKFGETYERKSLPAELSALWNLTELTCDSATRGGVSHVYLLGVEHNAQLSCDQVKALIEFVKPEAVFLELCDHHAFLLNPEFVFLEKNKIQRSEFFVANEEGKKYGAKVILGDLSTKITLDLRFFMVATLEFYAFLFTISYVKLIDIIKKCFEKDKLGAFYLLVEELSRICPFTSEFFLNERDQYMSATLLEAARKHKSVVAVVGKLHLRGIHKHWKQPVDVKRLLHTPSKTRVVACVRRTLNNPLQYFLPPLKDEATSQRTNGEECNHDGYRVGDSRK